MFGGLFSKRAVCPSYSRIHEECSSLAEGSPLARLEAAEALARQDVDCSAKRLEAAEARCKPATAVVQLKRARPQRLHVPL